MFTRDSQTLGLLNILAIVGEEILFVRCQIVPAEILSSAFVKGPGALKFKGWPSLK